jgi:glyoxylase-like metal-dependent hydrolase (beta-lactamase superfamily II)
MPVQPGLVLALIAAALLGFSVSETRAGEISLPSDLNDVSLVEVSHQIYILHGIQAMPDRDNAGMISNTGVILTESGVVVIDSGGSYAIGRLIVRKVGELTDKPIIAVFNTHIHGDHWLGNSAIRESYAGARFYAHQKAINRLQNGEAENWRNIIDQMVGDNSSGSLHLPNEELQGGETIDIDNLQMKVHHTGHAHTDSDIMIEVPGNRLLFTGDVVEYGRLVSSDVPQDFDARGQIEAIKYALDLPVDIFVPGHGETGGKEIPEASLKFLQTLYDSVQRNYEAGLADYEMKEQVSADLASFSEWFNFDQLGRMISFVFQQVESADFE